MKQFTTLFVALLISINSFSQIPNCDLGLVSCFAEQTFFAGQVTVSVDSCANEYGFPSSGTFPAIGSGTMIVNYGPDPLVIESTPGCILDYHSCHGHDHVAVVGFHARNQCGEIVAENDKVGWNFFNGGYFPFEYKPLTSCCCTPLIPDAHVPGRYCWNISHTDTACVRAEIAGIPIDTANIIYSQTVGYPILPAPNRNVLFPGFYDQYNAGWGGNLLYFPNKPPAWYSFTTDVEVPHCIANQSGPAPDETRVIWFYWDGTQGAKGTPPPLNAPDEPTNIEVRKRTIKWDAPANGDIACSYTLTRRLAERWPGNIWTFATAVHVYTGPFTEVTDVQAPPGNYYVYLVTANNSGGQSLPLVSGIERINR